MENKIYFDEETGEIFDNYEDYINSKNNDIENEFYDWDNTIIYQFRDTYARYNEEFQDLMDNWLYSLIDNPDYGLHKVAMMLQAGMADGHYVTYQVAYDEQRRLEYISKMLSYMPNITNVEKRLIMDIEESQEDGFDI